MTGTVPPDVVDSVEQLLVIFRQSQGRPPLLNWFCDDEVIEAGHDHLLEHLITSDAFLSS